ncbi:conjugative transposon protein TraJ [Olivibacter oleidegradans]|uniref:Conjugative transposon protein TraJ n=1 Tax=Olivibacter oleidegradans TaxID=760123 RepID=A0ABV6HIE8_9SPHI
MKKGKKFFSSTVGMLLLPCLAFAQGFEGEVNGLHGILSDLYQEMMPLCADMISVGQGIAGFAALWYIAVRVWRHIANAEAIDFFPLFRPFVLGFAIMNFPAVLAIINGVMEPAVSVTKVMVQNSNEAITALLKAKEEAIKESKYWEMYVGMEGQGDREKWYKYTHEGETSKNEDWLDGIGNDIRFAMSKAQYNFRNSIKEWMSEVLRVLYLAASLCIDTIRTFNMVVLSILGPLVFGLAVFDSFQNSLVAWLSRFINVYLWLPVANLFGTIIGRIQQKMLELDIGQIHDAGDTFFSSTDTAYMIFMIIAIVGYFTVPSVAGYIVNAGGGGAMLQKVTSLMTSSASATTHTAGTLGGRAMSGAGNIIHAAGQYGEGRSGKSDGAGISGSIGRSLGKNGAWMHDKLSGK